MHKINTRTLGLVLGLLINLFLCPSLTFANLSEPKPYSEQPKTVQRAIKPEVQIHSNQLQWSLDQSSVSGTILVDVVLTTLNNFHLYESKISFGLAQDVQNFWNLEVVSKPTTIKFFDPVSKGLVSGYSGQALFRLSLSPKNAQAVRVAETDSLRIIASFQACSESVCLFPTNLILGVNLKNEPPAVENKKTSLLSQDYLQGLLKQELGKSWIAFLILFFAGILTAFTPCVYPMYPITIGIFTSWSKQKSTNGFLLSLNYCLGITLTYATFGLITAATGSVFGSIAQSPWYLIGIGSVLLISGLLFSGIIPFTLPSKWIDSVTKTSRISKLGPNLQSFIYGATLGIVASPCVGPVLIGILSWTSALISSHSENAYLMGFLYLSTFGLGMCLPFLVMAALLIHFQYSPSLGRWTPWIKRLGTVLLIASSFYFLIPGMKYLSLQNSASETQKIDFPYTVYDFSNAPQNRPLLIDFRADWCAACLEIESKTLRNPVIVEHFKSQATALVKVDLTILTPENQAIAQKYGVLSLPALIFVNAKGEVCSEQATFEFIDAPSLLKKLKLCR